MGFQKVRDALREYFEEISFCRGMLEYVDVLAAFIMVLHVIGAFVSFGGLFNSLMLYVFFGIFLLAIASTSRLGLAIISVGQTAIALFGFLRSLFKYSTFAWDSFFSLAFWGLIALAVVMEISKHGLGKSILGDAFVQVKSKSSGTVRICPACSKAETDSKAIFCKSCGAKLTAEAQPVQAQNGSDKVCPKCGKRVNDEMSFCSVCGEKLK